MRYALLSHLAKRRAIFEVEVTHGVVESEAGRMRALPVLVVRDLVDGEKQIDEVAGCPETLVIRVRVRVRTEELAPALKEERPLAVGEDAVAVNPLRRLCRGCGVVWVEGTNEWRYRMQVGEHERVGGGGRHDGGGS